MEDAAFSMHARRISITVRAPHKRAFALASTSRNRALVDREYHAASTSHTSALGHLRPSAARQGLARSSSGLRWHS